MDYSPVVPSESAHMMRSFFKPANSNEHDNFGPETSEGEDLDMLSQDDLDGTAEPSKAMEYESDTSNDDSEEEEEERWEDEWSEEGEPSR